MTGGGIPRGTSNHMLMTNVKRNLKNKNFFFKFHLVAKNKKRKGINHAFFLSQYKLSKDLNYNVPPLTGTLLCQYFVFNLQWF